MRVNDTYSCLTVWLHDSEGMIEDILLFVGDLIFLMCALSSSRARCLFHPLPTNNLSRFLFFLPLFVFPSLSVFLSLSLSQSKRGIRAIGFELPRCRGQFYPGPVNEMKFPLLGEFAGYCERSPGCCILSHIPFKASRNLEICAWVFMPQDITEARRKSRDVLFPVFLFWGIFSEQFFSLGRLRAFPGLSTFG